MPRERKLFQEFFDGHDGPLCTVILPNGESIAARVLRGGFLLGSDEDTRLLDELLAHTPFLVKLEDGEQRGAFVAEHVWPTPMGRDLFLLLYVTQHEWEEDRFGGWTFVSEASHYYLRSLLPPP